MMKTGRRNAGSFGFFWSKKPQVQKKPGSFKQKTKVNVWMFGCILILSHFGLWFIDFSLDLSFSIRRISKMSSAGFEDQLHKISKIVIFP